MDDGTVFVVDDDASVRKGLSRLLRLAGYCCEAFESADAFLSRERYPGVACLILDINMPGMKGDELQQRLLDTGYELPVVFLTAHGDIPISVRAMRMGATNFLTKPVDEEILLTSIREALALHRGWLADFRQRDAVLHAVESLTPREVEIMQYVIAGAINKQIAVELGIAEKTVKIHRARAMKKMSVSSVADLVRQCEIAGISPKSAGESSS